MVRTAVLVWIFASVLGFDQKKELEFVSHDEILENKKSENNILTNSKYAAQVVNKNKEGSGNVDPAAETTSDPNSAPFTTHIPDEILKRIADQPGVNSAIDAILVLVVIQTMLGLGCTMDINLIKEHLYQPSGEYLITKKKKKSATKHRTEKVDW